jgi:hypothetical protein
MAEIVCAIRGGQDCRTIIMPAQQAQFAERIERETGVKVVWHG